MIRRVAALVLLGIRAPLRSRLALGLLAPLAVVFAGIRGDGTVQGEVRMLLTWTLGAATAVLGAATLWAGCAAVASDIEAGRHASTAVSPARPFEIWLGRWIGLVVVNGALLFIAVAVAYAQLKIKGIPAEATAVSRSLELAVDTLHMEAERLYAHAESQGAVPEGVPKAHIVASIEKDLLTGHFPVDPGQSREWVFKLRPGDAAHAMTVKFKFLSSFGVSAGCMGECAVLNADGDVVASYELAEDDKGEVAFDVPAGAVEGSSLKVLFTNTASDEGMAVLVQHGDSMTVLVPDGGVERNLFKSWIALLALLSLLAAIGVACGATFSFPVAAFTASALVLIAIVGRSDLAEEGREIRHSHGPVREKTAVERALDAFSKTMSDGVVAVLKPMSEVRALDRLGDGLAISPCAVLRSVFYTGLLLPMGFGVLAALALRRREL
ncbi:MAG: hypothetical protein ACOX9C_08875 [Kiritimatiellia bacterium]|jgi:hypothetical protein